MIKFEVEGWRNLDNKLQKLSRAAGKRALREALKKAAKPIEDAAQSAVPVKTGKLKGSIITSTKLNKAQKRLQKKQGGKAAVELFVGSSSPIAHLVEFGTSDTAAQPFMRPAFNSTKEEVMNILAVEVGASIDKAIGRAERRAAKGKK